MAKPVKSKARKKSKKKQLVEYVPFASPELKNSKIVSETLLECIRTGDLDSFRDVLICHIVGANKLQLAKQAGIARRTLCSLLDMNKKFNPELSTVSAIIRALAEQ